MTANGHVTADVLGQFLDNLTPRRIQQLAKEGVIPKAARGKYPLLPSIHAYIRYLKDQVDGRQVVSELDRARLDRELLEVRRRQLDVAKAEGKLVDMAHHEEAVEKLVAAFRHAVLALPGSWGPRVIGITNPAEGTEAMRLCAEDLLKSMQSKADELELDAGADGTPIPKDFPGRRALEAAGVRTFEELRALRDLGSLKGISPKLAAAIGKAMERAA